MIKRIISCIVLIIFTTTLHSQIYSRQQLDDYKFKLDQKKGISRINSLLELSEAYIPFQLDTAYMYAQEAGIASINLQYEWGRYKSLYCAAKVKLETMAVGKIQPILQVCSKWFETHHFLNDALYSDLLYINCNSMIAGKKNSKTIASKSFEKIDDVSDPTLKGLLWQAAFRYKLTNSESPTISALDSAIFYFSIQKDSGNIDLLNLKYGPLYYGSYEADKLINEVARNAKKRGDLNLEIEANRLFVSNLISINELDSLPYYIDYTLGITSQYKSEIQKAKTYHAVGSVKMNLSEFSLALDYFKFSESICKVKTYNSIMIKNLKNESVVYSNIGEYEKEIRVILKLKELRKKQQEILKIHELDMELGILYTFLNQLDKAEHILLENLEWIEEWENSDTNVRLNFISRNSSYLAQVYIVNKEYDKALKYLNQSILAAENSNKDTETSDILLFNLYVEVEDLERAELQYIKISNQYANILGHKSFLYFPIIAGKMFLAQENYKDAIIEVNNFLDKDPEIQFSVNYQASFEILYESHKALGNNAKALLYLENYNKIGDSLKNGLVGEKTLELESEYEISLKETEILNLQKQQEIQALELTQQNNTLELRKLYNVILGFGAVIILVVGYWLFHRYRNTKEKEKLKSEAKHIELELANLQVNQKAEIAEVKNMLFANISHEFRTPLTLIKVPAQNYMSKVSADDKPIFKGILKNADHLLKMVDELLDFSKMESGSVELRPSKFDINHLLAQTSRTFMPLFKDRHISFVCESLDEALLFNGDENRLKVVLNNLLKNAYNHTPEKGAVYFKVKVMDVLAKSGLSITVSNTGDGILDKDLPFIFDRFYRGDEQKYVGNGIGLSLCKQIVELHQGLITVNCDESNTVHFKIELPGELLSDISVVNSEVFQNKIAKSEMDVSIGQNQLNGDSLQYDILVVEDNSEMRALLNTVLNLDFRLHFAENGEVGEEMALEIQPDLILSDVMMPKKDGIELLASLKQNTETNHIPVILLTAKASIESQIIGLNENADDYIQKPFDAELLRAKIHNVLRQRQQLQKIFLQNPFTKSKEVQCNAIDAEFIDKVRNVLDANFHNGDFSVNEFCQELALNRNSVHNKIKAYTNKSTAQFIKIFRLKKALNMLLESNLSINDIYVNCGFNSPQSFNKAFKEQFNTTPTQYRSLGKSI